MKVFDPTRRAGAPAGLLRRVWIVPLSIIVVAAIAYGVAGLQSSSYTANSTVVVSSVAGPVQTAGAPNASSLAATYGGALPQDPVLRSFISRTAHVPLTVGRHRQPAITALPARGSSVTLRFNAGTRHAAAAGSEAIAAALRRRSPVSSVVSAGTLHVVGVSSPVHTHRRWHADVSLLVPPQTLPVEGINPDDAQHLATTYAGLIPADQGLLSTIGRATGQSSSTVSQNLSVVNTQSTSLLQISYQAQSQRLAAIGAAMAARSIAGAKPHAAGIVPGSIQLVSVPATPAAATSASSSSAKPVAIGAAVGLLLGIVLLIGWERSDPRIVDARGLSTHLGCPATPVERLSPEAARALLERWRSAADSVPARVAVLSADGRAAADAEGLIGTLLDAGGEQVMRIDAREGLDLDRFGAAEWPGVDDRVAVLLVDPGPADGEGPGEAVALSCDLTVVVIRSGVRAAAVRRLADELGSFGIVPAWALLSRAGAPARTARPTRPAQERELAS
ncbi:MAG: hypothetical protein ACRDMJ_18970 [Solirubrobacteraceae bacterium]